MKATPLATLTLLAAFLIPARAEDPYVRASALAGGDTELEEAVVLLWGPGTPESKVDRVFGLQRTGRDARGTRVAGILAALVDSGIAALDAEPSAHEGRKRYPSLRIAAIRAIGEVGDGSSVAAVVPWLADPRMEVRFTAVQALGFLGDPAGIEPLRARLEDADPKVQEMAAIHVKRLEGFAAARADLASADPAARARACRTLADAKQTGSAAAIAKLLGDAAEGVRAAAAAALGDLGHAAGAEGLAGLLADPSATVKHSAVLALGKLGAREQAGAARRLLADPDAGVRAGAAYACSRFKDQEAIPALAGLLDDRAVAPNAAAAMGTILDTGWGQNPSGVEAARAWWQEHGKR